MRHSKADTLNQNALPFHLTERKIPDNDLNLYSIMENNKFSMGFLSTNCNEDNESQSVKRVISGNTSNNVSTIKSVLNEQLNVDIEHVHFLEQKHGRELFFDDIGRHVNKQYVPHEGDGIVFPILPNNQKKHLFYVYTADCIPVFVIGTKYMSVLHCGWRSTAFGIVERLLELYHSNVESETTNTFLYAVIGAGISAKFFEFGEDNAHLFKRDTTPHYQKRDGRSYFDLKGYITQILHDSNIPVLDIHQCTYEYLEYPSYRYNKTLNRIVNYIIH